MKDEEASCCKEAIPWKEATQKIISASSPSEEDIIEAIKAKTTFKDAEEEKRILFGMKWLGLFSSEKITPRGNPLDTLCATLEKKVQYAEGERDLVM